MNFDKIIERTREIFNFESDKELAELFDITQQNFINRKKKGTLLAEVVNESNKLHPEVNLHWLLTGKGQKYITDLPPSPVDSSTMKSIIEAVEERLLRLRIMLKPDKKAEVITALYDYFVETGKEINKDTVERYLRLAA